MHEAMIEAFKEKNKENMLLEGLQGLFIEMLRAARSKDNKTYANSAAQQLTMVIEVLARTPETPIPDAIAQSVRCLGFREQPCDEPDKSLSRIAEGGISYLLEAAKGSRSTLLSRRRAELMRSIEGYVEMRNSRRKANGLPPFSPE